MISRVVRHLRHIGKPRDKPRAYEVDVVHKLDHDNLLFLKHERKSGPEEFPWLHQQITAHLENVVKLTKEGKQRRVARGDLPQTLFDGILP